MTQVTRRELMPGVWLRAIHTDKFKSSYLGLTMMAPLEWETAAANALIPAVLRRGTAAHPDLEALSAALGRRILCPSYRVLGRYLQRAVLEHP